MKNIDDMICYFKNQDMSTSLEGFLDVLTGYDGIDWENYVLPKGETYGRNVIFDNGEFECIIVSWYPGDKTQMHDHPENGCIFKILQGILHEITDNHEYQYTLGEATYIEHGKQHMVMNTSEELTISIHVYSPGKNIK